MACWLGTIAHLTQHSPFPEPALPPCPNFVFRRMPRSARRRRDRGQARRPAWTVAGSDLLRHGGRAGRGDAGRFRERGSLNDALIRGARFFWGVCFHDEQPTPGAIPRLWGERPSGRARVARLRWIERGLAPEPGTDSPEVVPVDGKRDRDGQVGRPTEDRPSQQAPVMETFPPDNTEKEVRSNERQEVTPVE